MIFHPIYGGQSSGSVDISFDGPMTETKTDEAGNWEFSILDSGNLVFNKALGNIDVFLVGGGGGGGSSQGSGGGGGYTTNAFNVAVTKGKTEAVVIGAAGAINGDGGNTTAFGYTAEGGKQGTYGKAGGDGGSGGGGYGNGDGGNGSNGTSSNGVYDYGGKGQKTLGKGSTRAFEEDSGLLCSGGGGAIGGGIGGDGGGGNAGVAGTDNLGGGGGAGAKGGKGLVIIRNHRGAV